VDLPVFETLLDAPAAFARYEAVRPRLPDAVFPTGSAQVSTLADTMDHFDGYVLDAFGVLNVGDTPIPGAVTRMAQLRAAGKRLCVLTNAASYTRSGAVEKYHRLGYDFAPHEVVTSRDVAAARLDGIAPGATWAAISASGDDYHDIPARLVDAIADPKLFDSADAILFLSSVRWTPALHDRLSDALSRHPGRPFVVANPDLVAPREDGLSLEPGLFAHDLMDGPGVDVHWFGKPFGDAFDDAAARLNLPRHRLAMVGDTLHTDVLGGRAAGMGTVLIADHGLFAGRDVAPFIAASGIVPDFIAAAT
jgi:HAD superfamily hydrolase (TIGR01459 family)